MKTALVLGAGGFIGSHMVKRLKSEGYWVRGVDLKYPEFSTTHADDFVIADLRKFGLCSNVMFSPFQSKMGDDGAFDEVYQFAADMGGAGYIFSGENDANVMHNSAQINLNVAQLAVEMGVKKVFYSSSACMYPAEIQSWDHSGALKESDAYPANPDSEYGWEKLFSERLYKAYERNYGLNIRIARFHNIYGPEGTYKGGKEKAPAAMCRKAIELKDGEFLTVWGNGLQCRSFLFIDDCIDAVRLLMQSDYTEPINIGSDEMVEIKKLALMALRLSNKAQNIQFLADSNVVGVKKRNSDNTLIGKVLGWSPKYNLQKGLELTYNWINSVHATI